MEWFAAEDYWVAREVIQRGTAVVYVVAFVAAVRQFRPLIGEHGLLPVPKFLARNSFRQSPSIFHVHYSDGCFAATCWMGAAVAVLLALGLDDVLPLWASIGVWLLLWASYLSIVNVGQIWYSFGWESLLVEAGFLVAFLGNDDIAPPLVILVLTRWLVFRVEFGAGLVKLRGDPCWRDLTCLRYHHETQPLPGPLSWFFHHLPMPLHRVEALGNHVAQLVVPFALFLPQPVAGIAAVIVIVTQLWLVASGNFAWLNWLTMVLAAAAISDSLIPGLQRPESPAAPAWFVGMVIAVAALVGVLSMWPVANMLSPNQRMNVTFSPWRLVNSYGAFGTVTRHRDELVIEGTTDGRVTETTLWHEYGFAGKPGDVSAMPRQWAPYHLRLDWLMWFAAISPDYAAGWLKPLLVRLLEGDVATLKLLGRNPFQDGPPRYVRVLLYRYEFSDWRELRRDGVWWRRELLGEYLPPSSVPRV